MHNSDSDQENKIIKEMIPYLINAIWPILLIALIAKIYGPEF